MREQVLRGLGWEILRVWSTDWWVDPAGTLERVHARLNELQKQDGRRRAAAVASRQEESGTADRITVSEPNVDAPRETAIAIAMAATLLGKVSGNEDPETVRGEALYARANSSPPFVSPLVQSRDRIFQMSRPEDSVPPGTVSADRFFEPSYDEVLRPMIEWVVEQEGPVLDTILARRIARAHGFQRTGSRIQERVEQIAKQRFKCSDEAGGEFYWADETSPGGDVPFRWPADDESSRGVEEICEQELASLAHWILESGKSGEDALVAMARELGLQKLRAASRGRLEIALSRTCN